MSKARFQHLRDFAFDDSGAAMVEYVIALLVVSVIGIGTMTVIGENADAIVVEACNHLDGTVPNTTSC